MKHLKSSFHDLHRIFEQSITVRDIAEPLASFDKDYSSDSTLEFMTSKGFDVVGVRCDGNVKGYVLKEDLSSGTIGEHLRQLEENIILDENAPMLRALEALAMRRWILIRSFGSPGGIVTRGDLQKAPMRMWLFGLISLLEMQMLRTIRAIYEEDRWWTKHLSEKRILNAKKLFGQRHERGEEIHLSDCLQIVDKATIFKKDETLFQLTGCSTKREWQSFTKKIESLRNNLAHSNDLATSSWPEIAELAMKIEQLLIALEAISV
ncbi:hypothetical protein N9B08_03375 [Akkermansiaceae bacterium]|nr:hypothetical protein [Akkermansiaceae bacterium]